MKVGIQVVDCLKPMFQTAPKAAGGRRLARVPAIYGSGGALIELSGGLEITFSPQRQPTIGDLGASFQALDRLHQRYGSPASELVLTEIRSGSIVAVVQTVHTLMGGALPFVSSANDVLEFGKHVRDSVKLLSGATSVAPRASTDAEEIKELLAPIAKNGGGTLNLRSLRYSDGKRHLDVEFNDNEVQRAYDRASLLANGLAPAIEALSGLNSQKWFSEEPLILEQTSRKPGREQGRTGDRGIMNRFSPKPLPVYFKRNVADVKERMILGIDNPMRCIFIVSGFVTLVDDAAASYMVTELHDVQALD